MKLPNADNAAINLRKLKDYCLNPLHPRGKHKARVFQSVLCISQDDAEILKRKILESLSNSNCLVGETDIHGSRYSVDIRIDIKERYALIRTTWIIKNKENFPRLTSCYIL